MIARSKWIGLMIGAWLALLPALAAAQITVSFYSHELGTSFPHAFFTLKGTPESGGTPVDTNFGFTARSVTPSILMGPVTGVVETVKPGYVKSSEPRFSLTINDAQYQALLGVVARWKAIPGKSYDLNHHNCVHFVGEAAMALGLKVDFPQALIKRPHSFLDYVIRLNPALHQRAR
jgi:hypothetical protein